MKRLLKLFAVLAVADVLGTLISCVVLRLLGIFDSAPFWPQFVESLRFATFMTFTFGAGVGAFEALRERLQVTTLELRNQQLERERAQKLATEAQLASLESRIHPHFLFNALNSISSLIREDPAEAERQVERMAALLRFSLGSARLRLVTLEQEMKIVRDYLDLEKVRFGERLHYELNVPPDVAGIEVPPMSVQTLVENSVKYAVATRREGGTIRVAARTDRDQVRIEVADDGAGFTLGDIQAGHGLENVQSRLRNLFGSEAALHVERAEAGMIVALTLPRAAAKAVA